MADTKQPMRGCCLCGAVRYEVDGPVRNVVTCHCGQCLKTHGNFAAYSATDKANLRLIEDCGLAWYASSEKARRGFCRECGASLFWQPDFADYVAVSAGSMDGPTGLKITRHIFVEDKPDWYEITDGLDQVEGSRYSNESA